MYEVRSSTQGVRTAAESAALTAQGTLPLKGLQYMSSLAVPAPSQKAAAGASTRLCNSAGTQYLSPAAPAMTASYGRLAPLHSTSRASGGANTHSVASERKTSCEEDGVNAFGATLASIGPSVRRLLMMDAEERRRGTVGVPSLTGNMTQMREDTHGVDTMPHVSPSKTKHGGVGGGQPTAHQTPPTTTGDGTEGTAVAAPRLAGVTLTATLDGTLTRRTWPIAGASPESTFQEKRRPRVSDTRRDTSTAGKVRLHPPVGYAVNGIRGVTVTRDPAVEPPLVGTLRRYLEREVRLAKDGCPAPSALDQLGPYREAFGALISAFPGYASLMSDIKAAYENVVQLQAELLVEAYTQEQKRVLSAAERKDGLADLQVQVKELERQLREAHEEMQSREAKRAAELSDKQRTTSAGARSDNFDLRRQLERSAQRISQLEEMSKHDVEKILLLIGAVRECDKRIKELESSVDNMSGQVEELDEFKRLAGEAQAELLRYKEKYRAFVPAGDFEAMKEYLVAELSTAQELVKRLRRTAAVRGTQLDVMQRRVHALQMECQTRDGLKAGEDRLGLVDDTLHKRNSPPLTPRPDWRALEDALPELADYAKPIHSHPLPTKATMDAMAVAAAGGPLAQNQLEPPPTLQHSAAAVGEAGKASGDKEEDTEDNPSGRERLVVPGPDRTVLRIEYLVDRVRTLQERVATLEHERDVSMKFVQQTHADNRVTGMRAAASPPPSGAVTTSAAGSARLGTSHGAKRGSMAAQKQSTHGGTPQTGSGSKRRSFATGNIADGDLINAGHSGLFGTTAGTLAPLTSRTVLPMPLVGPGMAEDVPLHLRCVGLVNRTVVDFDAGVMLTYAFFTRVLKPMIAEHETNSALSLTAAGAPSRFRDFLTTVLELGGIPALPPAHEAETLLVSAEDANQALGTTSASTRVGAPAAVAVGRGHMSSSQALSAPHTVTPQVTTLNLHFSCAAHLALNLEQDARDPQLTNPALLLNSYVLSGAMPARLAVEAATVVDRIVSDLNALATEAQKPRLQRSAINECLQPILELRSVDALAELRGALGTDATFDVVSLTSMKHRFLRTLFFQECLDNMTFYTKLVQALTAKAKPPSALSADAHENCEDGNYLISLEDVAAAIVSVEPLTPPIILRELSENAIASRDDESRCCSRSGGQFGGARLGSEAGDDEPSRMVKLSDILRAVAEAPVIRRTRVSNAMECAL